LTISGEHSEKNFEIYFDIGNVVSHKIPDIRIGYDKEKSKSLHDGIIEILEKVQKRMAQKKRSIGWFCPYVPQEIILASGAKSLRLSGRVDSFKESDHYMFGNSCLYAKNMLETGFAEKWSEIEAVVFANSCDCMLRLLDLWTEYVKSPPAVYVEVPRKSSQAAIDFFRSELEKFIEKLETILRMSIDKNDIVSAIIHLNEIRRLISLVFEKQKMDPPLFNGMELWSIIQQSVIQDPNLFSKPIVSLLTAPPSGLIPGGRPRILISGNSLDRPDLIEIIEKAGGAVVMLDDCIGIRNYHITYSRIDDPLENIARHYLLKIGCPRKPGYQERMDRIVGLVDEFSIDGVIFNHVKYCDYSLFEIPLLNEILKKKNVFFMALENDYIFSDLKRLGIRIEAFLEMIQTGAFH
jgi:benzoyl-CoA reductase/2-hydroxyglutaryl-CoA dehydratase subunit BcrC/BadD/HgdB